MKLIIDLIPFALCGLWFWFWYGFIGEDDPKPGSLKEKVYRVVLALMFIGAFVMILLGLLVIIRDVFNLTG